ncbi:hypothetical protein C6501_01985 [Candidatus Poribacteria bacterium]|nr:MAG: hypothetical protein C6501_01985 [Candidatus Poribacteria bacterium]
MPQNYDNMAKNLFTDYATQISQFVLGVKDVEVLENIDTEQQTIIGQRTDSTKRIRVDNREAILHIELQLRDSTHKPMWARNAAYHGYLVGAHELPVYSNVIYFHPNAGKNDTGIYEYSWRGYKYTLHYKVIRLINIDGQSVLEMNAPGVLPFTPLMKPPAGMDIEQWVQECVNATCAAPVDQRTQSDLLYALYLFGGIVYDSELFERLIPEELMQESKTYQRQVRKITIENTLDLLQDQFHAEAVSAITPALHNINDLQKLKQLHLAAAKVQSIEAFMQLLQG